jgi:hypothetical protein
MRTLSLAVLDPFLILNAAAQSAAQLYSHPGVAQYLRTIAVRYGQLFEAR